MFVKVYNAFYPYVYRYVYGLTYNHQTAEDLTQEAFVKALCTLQFPNENIRFDWGILYPIFSRFLCSSI